MCTPTIALVRSVIAVSIRSGSIVSVTGSISAKTGINPHQVSALTVAGEVNGVVMTSPESSSAR